MAARSRLNLLAVGAALLTVNFAVAWGAPPRGAPATSRPATKPVSTAKLTPAQKAAVDSAVDALRKEVAANQKNPKAALRTQADFFADKKPAVLTPDAVLTALEQPIPGDVRAAAYIRWQLMSVLPEKLDEALVERALAIYRQAPLPLPRYGLGAADQAVLESALQDARKQDDVLLNARLQKSVTAVAEKNRPIIAYRDEWYRRLPKGPRVLVFGLLDALERGTVAAGAEDWVPTVIADIENWALLEATPAQCAAMADVVGQLRVKSIPTYYAEAAVRRDKLTWVKKADTIDPRKKLTHLHELLVEQAQKPPKAKPAKK
jgi:hypothetical protein